MAKMEDVLDVYQGSYDDEHVLICMDEKPKQLIAEVRRPLPCEPGQPVRYDYEYKREGVVSLFILFDPIRGWRHVEVRQRRTKEDWAEVVAELVEVHYREAERITLVMDNLNTHTVASLYEAFEPERARRIARKLEIHYTPEHGSWLNMAEIELSVLERQCVGRRMESVAAIEAAVGPWEAKRNGSGAAVEWRFTTAEARVKLRRLYPSIDQ